MPVGTFKEKFRRIVPGRAAQSVARLLFLETDHRAENKGLSLFLDLFSNNTSTTTTKQTDHVTARTLFFLVVQQVDLTAPPSLIHTETVENPVYTQFGILHISASCFQGPVWYASQ